MTAFRRYSIDGKGWGAIKVLRPIVDTESGQDPWGELAPLKGTPFEGLIPIVSGEALSHALHGYLKPLLGEIGPDPKSLARMVPKAQRECEERKRCPMYVADCHPGPKQPDCFEPSGLESDEARAAAGIVTVAWAEGRYVLIVVGEEFSL